MLYEALVTDPEPLVRRLLEQHGRFGLGPGSLGIPSEWSRGQYGQLSPGPQALHQLRQQAHALSAPGLESWWRRWRLGTNRVPKRLS